MKTLLECLQHSLNESNTVSYTYAAEDYLSDSLSIPSVDLPTTFISISNQELDAGPDAEFEDYDTNEKYRIKDLVSKDVNICLEDQWCDFNKNTIKCKTLVITSRGDKHCDSIRNLNIVCKVLYLLPNLLDVDGNFDLVNCSIKCDKMYTVTDYDSIIDFSKANVQCKEIEVLSLDEPYEDLTWIYGIEDSGDEFFDKEVDFDPVGILTFNKIRGLKSVTVGSITLTQDKYDFDPEAGEQGGTGYDGKMGDWVWVRN